MIIQPKTKALNFTDYGKGYDQLFTIYSSTRAKEMQLLTNWNEQQKDSFLRFQFYAQHTYYLQQYKGANFGVMENITIVRVSDNEIVETIPVNSSQVTGSCTGWTINPSITLAGSTQYAVKSDPGSFKNAGGTIFGGVSLSTVQSFTTATTIDSVSLPANGTYKAGDNLDFPVSFSEDIAVNSAGGTPYIPVTVGGAIRNASYLLGSGTSVLTFRYTVAAGDSDIDGVALGASINLNGGTLRNLSLAVAPLTLNNIASTTGVLVDGVAPLVSSITRADADTTSATSIDFAVAFSENVSGVDITDFALTTTGTATGTISGNAGAGSLYTVTVTGVDGNGTIRLDVKASGTGIVDGAGNANNGGYTSGEVYTIVQPSNSTDYFRTITSADWNNPSTWESSIDNVTYHAASLAPDFNANLIIIRNSHTVTVTSDATVDQTTVDAGGALIVAANSVLTLNDGTGWDLVVNGSLTVNTGGTMIVTSTVTGTASEGNSAGTISGQVTFERYVPARRAWRLTTAPLTNANTIRDAWQNNATNTAGMGTFITSPSGANGLDKGNSYSLKSYNVATQLLEDVNNTNVSLSGTAGSADNKGYFLFVRGDRDPANLTPANTNSTTLTAKGALQVGIQAFTVCDTAEYFTLIGNPYASPVDFSSITRNNVAKRFYVWDPALNTTGAYVLLDDADNDGIYSVTPTSSQTSIITSGQAVFVQTISDSQASITFEESSKSDVSASAGFRPNNGSTEILRANLYVKNADNTSRLADGVIAEYNNNYNPALNMEDALKLSNLNENLAIQRNRKALALERRPLADNGDTLFLKLTGTTTNNYRFEFVPSNFSGGVTAWLEDTYLNTSSQVSLDDTTVVDFIITSRDPASAGANRFRIVYKAESTLPVTLTAIKAFEKDKGIIINWNVAQESNMDRYDVEKLNDGQTFITLSEVTASGNNNPSSSYSAFDANPSAGNNFYRIKFIDKTGDAKYSEVVNVKLNKITGDITIYPNPVTNRVLKLKLNNQPAGAYSITLFNGLGQKVFVKSIVHVGGSANQQVLLPSIVSKGIYQLHVSNVETTSTHQLVVE